MNRRYADMQTNVGNNVQDTSTATQAIIKRMINDTYFDVLRRFNWGFINHDYTITTVSGTQDYELPRDFDKEISVLDDTNNIVVEGISAQELLRDYPATWDSSGTVERYIILKKKVLNQPSSASVITVSSDDATDTTQTMFVRGIVDSVEQTESVTLTGTSSAATTNSFTRIISISFSAARAGKVTITSNAAAVTNATVAPEVLDYEVKCIRFHSVPTGAITVKVPYEIAPLPLNDDNDVPLIAADIIEHGATSAVWRYKRQMQKAQEWERIYEKAIIQLIWDKENQTNRVITMNPIPYSRETV